ncbi:putative protein kinase [Plasmopara halstedii]
MSIKQRRHLSIQFLKCLLDSRIAEVMIADFGFARPMNGSRRGTACGTPGYVAPEVVQGEPYGAEVDCWSLGVILFILLCGYPPFPGANHATVLDKVVKAEYKFEAPYWDDVSDEAKDLVTELLAIDRTKRLTASGILAHPWMDETRASSMSLTDESESRKRFTRKCSDLLPALHQMRKHSLTHGSPKIRPSDMNALLERELADMDGFWKTESSLEAALRPGDVQSFDSITTGYRHIWYVSSIYSCLDSSNGKIYGYNKNTMLTLEAVKAECSLPYMLSTLRACK